MTNPATEQRLMEKRMRMKTHLRTRIRRRNHVSPKFVQIWTSLLPICHVRVMGIKIDFSISFVLENAAETQVFLCQLVVEYVKWPRLVTSPFGLRKKPI